jgi:DNA-binding MarR family transcriptional regulator
MDKSVENLNNLLVELYNSVIKIEEQTISSASCMNLSINEIHLIEAIAKDVAIGDAGKTISEISEIMKVTLPSITLAINKLVKKGYAEKRKSDTDGRVVHVTLTKRGEKVNRIHKYFHNRMVKAATQNLNDDELNAIVKGANQLIDFMKQNMLKEE